jgi:hypothetical protein
MDIIVPGNAAKPEQVAKAIVKTLFRGGLPADKEYLAFAAINGALTKWREQLLAKGQAELEKTKTEARDQMMRADEALLRLESLKKDHGIK